MHLRRIYLLASALLVPLAGPLNGATVTLTFENPPFEGNQDPYGPGQVFYEQGFAFSTTVQNASSIIRFAPGQGPFVADNGTVHFGNTAGSRPTLSADGNAPFTLFSIDLAHYSAAATVPSVTLLGTFLGGGTVSETFAIGDAFQTFTLPQTWTNLIKVELPSSPAAWDNVTVAAIPEPAAAGLLLTGIAAAFRRRRPASR